MESKPIEYEVPEIGSNALAGMLVRQDAQGEWYVAPVTGLDLVINYEKCLVSIPDLVKQVASLYARGAKSVELVQWIPQQDKEVNSILYRSQRRKATELPRYTLVQAPV